RVGRLDAVDRGEHGAHARADLRVPRAREAERSIGRGERVAVVPLDAWPDLERPLRLPVELPLGRECRVELAVGTARDQIVEEVERSEEHTSELQSRFDLVCRLLLEKKKNKK